MIQERSNTMLSRICVLVLTAVTSLAVFADVSDDAISLSQSGASEGVIATWAQNQHGVVTAQDIQRMKSAGVSERVIQILTRLPLRFRR